MSALLGDIALLASAACNVMIGVLLLRHARRDHQRHENLIHRSRCACHGADLGPGLEPDPLSKPGLDPHEL